MMKKIIYVAVTVMLLVGCTTKNEPSNSQKVPVSTTSLDVDYYEQMYQAFISSTLPEILHLDSIHPLWDLDLIDDVDLIDTSYTNVSNIVQAYCDDRVIYNILVNTLNNKGIRLDIDEYLNSAPDENLMTSLLQEVIEMPYITLDYRTSIFENDNISDNDKVTLCFVFAIKNIIYKKIYGRTIVVIDEQGRYFSTQVPESVISPFEWREPWDIYEVFVEDVSNFYIGNLFAYSNHSVEYESQDERDNYFYELETTYILYVTREECDLEYNESIDDLENEIVALAIAGLILIPNPAAYGINCLMNCTYYMVRKSQIVAKYNRCIEEADAETED